MATGRQWQSRLAQGLCAECGRPRDNPQRCTCDKCREARRTREFKSGRYGNPERELAEVNAARKACGMRAITMQQYQEAKRELWVNDAT